MLRTIKNNWLKVFKIELKGTSEVCIVSPFITDNIVNHLVNNFKGDSIKVITRYNLYDFKKGVSSLSAIQKLLNSSAQIKGVKNLHSKLYLFEKKSVIITSANFTNGGFFNNKEFGVFSTEDNLIKESIDYFNFLWSINPDLLDLDQAKKWETEIDKANTYSKSTDKLPDYGVSYQEKIIDGRRYFVKFFGSSDYRKDLNFEVKKEIEIGCSHFALSFSKPVNNARPRRYRDGDIVFMALMTNTQDYAIFGRATTFAHKDERDVVSVEDTNHIEWLKEWPILVRVKDPKYINSTLKNCPKLNDLIDDLDYASFKSTKEKYESGIRNIKPKNSLMRKGDVMLSDDGAQWMEEAFEKAIEKEGMVDDKIIKSLYQGLKLK